MKKKLLTGIIATTISVGTAVPSLVSCSKITGIEITGPSQVILSETGIYTATIQGEGQFDKSITWSLEGDSSLGAKISQDGKLTTGSKVGQVTVVATSVANPEIRQLTIVNLVSPVTEITVSTTTDEIYADSITTLQFSASVTSTGGKYNDVIWSIKNADKHGAEINANGLLTAPNATCDLTIVATSKVDSSKYGEKTIHATRVKSITITPIQSIVAGQPVQLVSKVTYVDDTTDANVYWNVTWGVASITPTGILTADKSRVQDVTIKVNAKDDETKSFETTIHSTTVKSVSIAGPDTIMYGTEQQYTADAEITGGPDAVFSWKGEDVGQTGASINKETGVLTTGNKGISGDYKITAIPDLEPSKSVTKTVHITPVKNLILNSGSDVLEPNTSMVYDFGMVKWDDTQYSKGDLTITWETTSGDFAWDSETSTLTTEDEPGSGVFTIALKDFPNEKKEYTIRSFKHIFTVDPNEQAKTVKLTGWSEEVQQLDLKSVQIPNKYIADDGTEYKVTELEERLIGYIGYGFDWKTWIKNLKNVNFQMPCYLTSLSKGCFFGTQNLKKIDVPDTIEEIKCDCFRQCDNLESLNFSKTSKLRKVGDNFMSFDNKLKTIYFPKLLESITMPVSTGVRALESIEVDTENTYFSSYNGSNCMVTLKDVTYGEDEKIPANTLVFGAAKTQIPNTVKAVANDAFYDNDALKSIEIPSSVESLGREAFYDCDELKTLTLNEGLKTIGEACFWNAFFEKLDFPTTLESIGKEAFNKFEHVVLPKNIKLDEKALASGSMNKIDLTQWGLTSLPAQGDWNETAFAECANGGTIYVVKGMTEDQKTKWKEALAAAGLDPSKWEFEEIG